LVNLDLAGHVEEALELLRVVRLGLWFARHGMNIARRLGVRNTGYVRSTNERVISILSQMAAAIRVIARSATDENATSLEFSYSLGCGETTERVEVATCPCIPAIPGELVRADIDKDYFAAFRFPICDLLRSELEPFIIGVGRITVNETNEGLVVLRADAGQISGSHEIRS
jgi:hypothetical protein